MIRSSEILNPEALICAIVKCAVADYKAELRKKKRLPNQNISDLSPVEKFFQSENFEYWTGIDGDKLIAAIKEKEVKKTKKRKKKANTGR
jgi:hypothetical protein